ncbi:MAG: hypothetical protein K6G90_08315, partial [Clostridia bacterium]|nr:hypothetical protein [Clostridia bacterium]
MNSIRISNRSGDDSIREATDDMGIRTMFLKCRKRQTRIVWLFASFMLLQFVILRMGNQAGR